MDTHPHIVEIDVDTLSELVEAADNWSTELSDYIIPEADEDHSPGYTESQESIDAAIATARALYTAPAVPRGFWPQIDHQLDRIRRERPETFDAVRAILLDPAYDEVVAEVNRNFPRTFSAEAAFFAGVGGENTLRAALVTAGWRVRSSAAWYHYALTHPITDETLTYIEGDVERNG